MRRLVVASALGFALLATAGLGGTASAMPWGAQASVAAPDAGLLVPAQYYRPYGHQYHRPYYAHRRHYAPPPRHHWRHRHHGWRR